MLASASSQPRLGHCPGRYLWKVLCFFLILTHLVPHVRSNNQTEQLSIHSNEFRQYSLEGQMQISPAMGLLVGTSSEYDHIDCSGIFLTRRIFLTAAYCVTNPDESSIDPKFLVVLARGHPPHNQVTSFKVASVLPHQNYDRNLQQNDIAMVRLQELYTGLKKENVPKLYAFEQKPEALQNRVPTEIPENDEQYYDNREEDEVAESNKRFLISDWVTGEGQGGGVHHSDLTPPAPANILARHRQVVNCRAYPRYFQDFKKNLQHRSIICVKPSSEDIPCVGKAGCPLWIRTGPWGRELKLAGFKSFSYTRDGITVHDCSIKSLINVYTRLDNFMAWIRVNSKLSDEHLISGTRSFTESDFTTSVSAPTISGFWPTFWRSVVGPVVICTLIIFTNPTLL
ncbi:hypothetical protein BJ085DRAFT_39806 [Dimargaris cristalligena]|uniref:Peptidase S1 domain-containing protein n=1 Tax=Dimargaris cristalligena TaxID=215637 RepID=A0A4P9ZWZ8_9FUNG|nr:hypothetical protein BJ085DRAFT_39806 [Dimargaris cristalligena]|eukprot:RKP37392.1 hypothetical protein BJ085DRAFT_39806 [Dimargaris cristalligena]